MNREIVCVGRLKERFWKDACDEYLKRLGAYGKTTVRELADVDPARAGGEDAAKQREGEAILSAIPQGRHVVLLDVGGKAVTSEGISARLDALALEGTSAVSFVIGGSCGVSDEVRRRADERWSLGAITLPHNLARVVLLEQLYRAAKISKGEPYHK